MKMNRLTDNDYNILGYIGAFAFLGIGLANRVIQAPRFSLLIMIFMPISLLFFVRSMAGSWDFIYTTPKEQDTDATN